MHDVVLGELQERHDALRLRHREGGHVGKAQVHHFDLVAALLVEADGRAHQRRDAVDLVLVTRLIDRLAFVVLAVVAVDQHGDRDSVDAAALAHLGLGRARDLVVDDLLRLARLVARRGIVGRPLLLRAGQIVPDRHLSLAAVGAGRFLPRLARAHDAAFRIEPLGGLGHAIEVEIGGELHAGAAGADHRGDDALDLLAQAPLVGDFAFVGPDARTGIGLCAVGEQAAAFIDDRHPLGAQAVDGRGNQMADRAHLLRLELPAHLEHDRGGGLDLLAREQRPFRQHQVDARTLHAVDGADGAGELALERAQVVDVLNEAGGAEGVGLVEDLVADAAAFGQARFGELHAQLRHTVLRHQDDGALVLELVGDALAIEVLQDRRRVLEGQVGEERRHLRRGDAQDQESEERDQRDRHRGHGRNARRPERLQELDQSLHVSAPNPQPGKNCPVHGY